VGNIDILPALAGVLAVVARSLEPSFMRFLQIQSGLMIATVDDLVSRKISQLPASACASAVLRGVDLHCRA